MCATRAICSTLSMSMRQTMMQDFWSKLDRVLQTSASSKEFQAKERAALIRTGIDCESKLLPAIRAKKTPRRTAEILLWLLPRWPKGSRNRQFFLAVRTRLSDASAHVRAEAAGSLGLFELPDAVQALRKALDDPDKRVQVRAVLSLGLRGDEKALPSLFRLLTDQRKSATVREVVADALSGFPVRYVRDALIDALSDRAASVRVSAVHSLGELRVRQARTRLELLLSTDRSANVRQAARVALVKIRKKWTAGSKAGWKVEQRPYGRTP